METKGNDPISAIQNTDGYLFDRSDIEAGGPFQLGGLTKREYFAALALQGFIQSYKSYSYGELAECSVKATDALIEALNK